jgi:DNA-binding CsgD family transcriptional regulator
MVTGPTGHEVHALRTTDGVVSWAIQARTAGVLRAGGSALDVRMDDQERNAAMEHKSLVAVEQGTDPGWMTISPLPAMREQTSFFRVEVAKGSAGLWQAAVEAHVALNETIVTAATLARKARAMTIMLEEALATLAVSEADLSRRTSTETQDFALLASLSVREREVLALVAEGHSNRAIAGKLFISPNTVKSHVASLLTKLRADSRVELATLATRHHVDGLARAPFPDAVRHESQLPSTP